MLSTKFIEAVKSTGMKIHDVAWASGVSASQLYRFTAGIDRPKPGDPRIERICKYIGLKPGDAYEQETISMLEGSTQEDPRSIKKWTDNSPHNESE